MGKIIQDLEPSWKIKMFERLGCVGEESSNGWNNAGTGHAALCEPNYTPADKDGNICPEKAKLINEQFQVSRQWYADLIKRQEISPDFVNVTPHVTFARGEKDVEWLKARFEVLKDLPLFQGMEFSEDPEKIREWSPLLMNGRDENEKVAATFMASGTDIDFGDLTRQVVKSFTKNGGECLLYHTVTGLKRETGNDGKSTWNVRVAKRDVGAGHTDFRAKFVFVGGGGWALPMLQKSGIPEIKGFAGFPISGEFLVCQKQEVVKSHGDLKVYGRAEVGAPPMSVPHLDKRVIDGNEMLLFGPYAGFSPRFLKTGGMMDLIKSIKLHNLMPMTFAGLANLDLCVYLVKELLATKKKRLTTLRKFAPEAKGEDWALVTAGQRVQCMKKCPKKVGILQFGTELVAAADGSICGLLGASPGASIAVPVMYDALAKCFPDKFKSEWEEKIKDHVPYFGTKLNDDADAAVACLRDTAAVLGIKP